MHDYTSELLIKPLSTNINENIKDIKCFISKFIFCGTIKKNKILVQCITICNMTIWVMYIMYIEVIYIKKRPDLIKSLPLAIIKTYESQ